MAATPFYGESTANNVCYTQRRTYTRNVRIISLRIITHYIPRYTVCIVYYAARPAVEKLWDFCGPAVMGLAGPITMRRIPAVIHGKGYLIV